MNKLEIISPIKDLTDLDSEILKTVEQQFNLKQQIFGKGKNQAQIIMIGPVVVAQSEEVMELLKSLGQPEIEPQLGVREALTRILEMFPEPRMENLKSLARSIALETCGDNRTHAAKYLGVSVRTLRNNRDKDSQVKEIEDGV